MKKIKLNSVKYFNRLLPAPTCVICGNSLSDSGGRRITSQKLRGIAVWGRAATVQDRDYLASSIHLNKESDVFLIVWGEADVFTPVVVERIRQTYLSGVRPWMCSAETCGHRQCSKCGKGQNFCAASDILYDDGANPYAACFMGTGGCSNSDCEDFRELEGWGVVRYQKPTG